MQKAHQEPIQNIHTKVQIISLVEGKGGICEEQIEKKERPTKEQHSRDCEWDAKRLKSRSPLPEGTSRTPVKCTYQISTHWLNLEGSYARNKIKTSEYPHKKNTFMGSKRPNWFGKSELPKSISIVQTK